MGKNVLLKHFADIEVNAERPQKFIGTVVRIALELQGKKLEDVRIVVLGVGAAGFAAEIPASMAYKPVVFALSNPVPEVRREAATAVRYDMIMTIGHSD